MPSIVTSNSARTLSRGRARSTAIVIAATAAALLISGCDRQKGPEPQPKENSAAPKAGDGASGIQRYRIDLSGAGSALPAIELSDSTGQKRSLETLKGKPILLNLWATWCAPCVEELPTINALASQVGESAHVVTLSQDIGGDGSVPRDFLNERGWTQIEAWHDPDNELGITVGGQLPTTIIYDRAGLEVGRVIGPLDWNGPEARRLLKAAGFPE